jgi:hypothetical protein
VRDDLEPPSREFDRGDDRWAVGWDVHAGSFNIAVRPRVVPEPDESSWYAPRDAESRSVGDDRWDYDDVVADKWVTVPALVRSVDGLESLIDGGLTPELRAQFKGDVAAHEMDEDAWKPWSEPVPTSAAEQAKAASDQMFPMSARMSIQQATARRAASPLAALSATQLAARGDAQGSIAARSDPSRGR